MIKLRHLPLNKIVLNSPYGTRSITVNNKYYWWHNGADFRANVNTPVYAVSQGKVMVVKYNSSYGYYIALDHGKFGSLYAHLDNFNVKENDSVNAGDVIGYSGATGDATGPHLHFEIRLGNYENFWDRAHCDNNVFMNTVDPMLFIEDFLNSQREISFNEAINIVQSAAGLEDKTMNYIARYYKFGEDLVKKLAKAIL